MYKKILIIVWFVILFDCSSALATTYSSWDIKETMIKVVSIPTTDSLLTWSIVNIDDGFSIMSKLSIWFKSTITSLLLLISIWIFLS